LHSTKQKRCSRAPGFKCIMWSRLPVFESKSGQVADQPCQEF
jgi:hypothetical protein